MMKKIFLTAKLLFFFSFFIIAQNLHDNVWLLSNGITPSIISWGPDSIKKKSSIEHIYSFSSSGSMISDAAGSLRFYGNGCVIYGKNNKLLPNGKGINPGDIYDSFCPGSSYPEINAFTLLPCPEDTSRYFAFHIKLQKAPYIFNPNEGLYELPRFSMLYTEIDTKLNNGIGDVPKDKKNVLIVADSFSGFGVFTCRHANGKDWWIIAPKLISMGFQRALLTSKGVQYVGVQYLNTKGLRDTNGRGQGTFTPDGKQLILADPYNQVLVFDFDRCTGLFSKPKKVFIREKKDIDNMGVEVSPNSKLMYITTGDMLHQLRLDTSDVQASKMLIDTFDGTKDPLWNTFHMAELAPNGKIYIAPNNTSQNLHTIHQPNLRGKACDFRQHDFRLPEFCYVNLPNMPNYRLGASDPNCKLPVATQEAIRQEEKIVNIYPNPSSGLLHINMLIEFSEAMTWELFDSYGHQVFHQALHQLRLDINLPSHLPKGIYFWRILDKQNVLEQGKIVLLE